MRRKYYKPFPLFRISLSAKILLIVAGEKTENPSFVGFEEHREGKKFRGEGGFFLSNRHIK